MEEINRGVLIIWRYILPILRNMKEFPDEQNIDYVKRDILKRIRTMWPQCLHNGEISKLISSLAQKVDFNCKAIDQDYIAMTICEIMLKNGLLGSTESEAGEVEHLLVEAKCFSQGNVTKFIRSLNEILRCKENGREQLLVGKLLTLADVMVWSKLQEIDFKEILRTPNAVKGCDAHVIEWFDRLSSLDEFKKGWGSFNQRAKVVMRFRDSSPNSKWDYNKAIQDAHNVGIRADRYTRTSDYFDVTLDFVEKLLNDGNAYVDDTDISIIEDQRVKCEPSKNRRNTKYFNKRMWDLMKAGEVNSHGKCLCVRAIIAHTPWDPNLPDPVPYYDPILYHYAEEPHPRYGSKYKVYPTYFFSCPIMDIVEGVTHARRCEINEKKEYYDWIVEKLNLKLLEIHNYSANVQGLSTTPWADGLGDFISGQRFPGRTSMIEWDDSGFVKEEHGDIVPRYTANLPQHRAGAESGTLPLHIPIRCVYHEKMFTKVIDAKDEDFCKYINYNNKRTITMYGEADMAKLRANDIIQLKGEKGFYRCEQSYYFNNITQKPVPCVLIYIPDDHSNQLPRWLVEADKKSSGKEGKDHALEQEKYDHGES